jgi:anti-sigma B factor antagonist
LLRTREVDCVTIVDVLSFNVLLDEAYCNLRDAVDELLKKGVRKIIINMDSVGYIDSLGIGDLVDTYSSAKGRSAQIKLLHVHKKVHDLLVSTRLAGVFEIFDNEQDAVRSFV